jgi:3-dehydroquinate dehydratase/shikimate dehydrogenase
VAQITPRTQLFGVIADPVAHSHSPIVHNVAFEQQQLDSRYIPFRVPADELELFLEACPELGIRGLSVTIPHKEAVLPYLTQAEAAVNGIGAANTIIFDGEERIGFNTDYRAAMDCLTEAFAGVENKADFRGRTVKILGAGGAARAIGWGLKQRGADVIFSNRTLERAGELAMELGARVLPWEERHEVACGLLVNCTPSGMHPDLDSTPYDGNRLDSRMVVFDTVYNPEQTLLVKQARQAGCKVITGVEMFVRQAAYQYKLFTGREPPVALMRDTLKRATSPVSVAAAAEV